MGAPEFFAVHVEAEDGILVAIGAGQHNGVVPEDLLMSGDDESQMDFMTAEEKVEELQALLAQKEDEIDHLRCQPGHEIDFDRINYLEQRVEEQEREK